MKNDVEEFKSFEDFTNLYEVQKTLRFELKPVGKTKELLEQNKVFEKDEKIEENYQKTKPLFDGLHRKFVAEALEAENIDQRSLVSFAKEYGTYCQDIKKNKKIFESAEQKLQKEFVKNFDKVGKEWKARYNGKIFKNGNGKDKEIKLKSDGFKVLTDQSIMGVLAIEYPEKSDLFGSFDGFFGYFTGFNQTRENFYKDDGTAAAVATRAVDNFVKFLTAKQVFDAHYVKRERELKLTTEEKHVFEIEYYSRCLLQKGIEQYNKIVGELNKKMKMLRDQQGRGVNKKEYPLINILYDQILGEKKKSAPFVIIKNDEDAKAKLDECLSISKEKFSDLHKLVDRLLKGDFNDDLDEIFLTSRAINTISRRWFCDSQSFECLLPSKGKSAFKDGDTKVAAFVSFSAIQQALSDMKGDVFKVSYFDEGVIRHEQKAFDQFLAILWDEFNRLFTGDKLPNGIISVGLTQAENELRKVFVKSAHIKAKEVKEKIKVYLDSGLAVFQMGKYFSLEVRGKKDTERPINPSAEFYNDYDKYAVDFRYAGYYDDFRNYLSKKHGDNENKVKLNFENGMLLNGWDRDKECDYQGFLFEENGKKYIGITDNENNSLFLDEKAYIEQNGSFKKMRYKQLNNVFRQLPHLAFAKSNVERYSVTDEHYVIYNEFKIFQENKRNNDDKFVVFDHIKMQKLIELYKNVLKQGYAEEFDFGDIMTTKYEKLNDFFNAVEEKTYSLAFISISKEFVMTAVDVGKLYLFEIHNKDNNLKDGKAKTGTKNIHTMYWESLFSEENLKENYFKLSGGAEVFLRRGKPEELQKVKDKNELVIKYKDGNDVIEHKRYAEDKLFFHVPLVLNRGVGEVTPFKHNLLVRQYLAQTKEQRVIGIDRGEKHLLYCSVINQNGEIIDQRSLNTIKGINYYEKLVNCEKQRRIDRQSWEPARKIKDLKKGYISQAVYAVCELIKEHHAIVVLEDLNMRFKQVRGGVERSVYQQFENALINKLGYLVFKERLPDEKGGVFSGYQLAAPFESFEKMGKQTGFLFYTQANYTSVTDPLSGFRKNVYISNSTPDNKIKDYFKKDKIDIGWDKVKNSYYFFYDQEDFVTDKKSKVNSKKWNIYANVPRIKRFKENGYWKYGFVNPNMMLEELFCVWNIEDPHDSIVDKIQGAEAEKNLSGKKKFDGDDRSFWKSLIFIFNLILQLRNSSSQEYAVNEKGEIVVSGEDVDFIASPVEPFFKTAFSMGGKQFPANFAGLEKRIIGNDGERILKEFNGDANGSYNIARKGLLTIKKIKKFKKDNNDLGKMKYNDLAVNNGEWDNFTQDQFDKQNDSIIITPDRTGLKV